MKIDAHLLLHRAGEHLNALHVDGPLDALLELFVLASFPTHPDEAAATGQYDEQSSDADAYHAPVRHCTREHEKLHVQ